MYHVERLLELVLLLLRVALGAVKPLFAARRTNGGLNVEDVFAPGECGMKRWWRWGDSVHMRRWKARVSMEGTDVEPPDEDSPHNWKKEWESRYEKYAAELKIKL